MTENHIQKLYTTEEAAKLLGVKPDTLRIWKCTGRYNLPTVKIGRLVKYRHIDLSNFIDDNIDATQNSDNKLGDNNVPF